MFCLIGYISALYIIWCSLHCRKTGRRLTNRIAHPTIFSDQYTVVQYLLARQQGPLRQAIITGNEVISVSFPTNKHWSVNRKSRQKETMLMPVNSPISTQTIAIRHRSPSLLPFCCLDQTGRGVRGSLRYPMYRQPPPLPNPQFFYLSYAMTHISLKPFNPYNQDWVTRVMLLCSNCL